MKFKDLTAARFVLFNILCFGLLGWAFFQGWPQMVFENDSSYITWTIAGLFTVGWVWCLIRIIELTRQLNEVLVREGPWLIRWHASTVGKSASLRESIKMQLSAKIAPVRQIAGTLVILGLIGTVVGFIMAVQSLDMSAVGDTDAAAVMLGEMMAGMGVALYTTLCGAVFSVWLMTCYRILQGAANSLAAKVFES